MTMTIDIPERVRTHGIDTIKKMRALIHSDNDAQWELSHGEPKTLADRLNIQVSANPIASEDILRSELAKYAAEHCELDSPYVVWSFPNIPTTAVASVVEARVVARHHHPNSYMSLKASFRPPRPYEKPTKAFESVAEADLMHAFGNQLVRLVFGVQPTITSAGFRFNNGQYSLVSNVIDKKLVSDGSDCIRTLNSNLDDCDGGGDDGDERKLTYHAPYAYIRWVFTSQEFCNSDRLRAFVDHCELELEPEASPSLPTSKNQLQSEERLEEHVKG